MARNKANVGERVQGEANVGERVQGAGEVSNVVQYHLNEFAKLKSSNKSQSQSEQPKWKPPWGEHYKINIDAGISNLTRMGGWGCMATTQARLVLDIGAGFIQRAAASVIHAEALQLSMGWTEQHSWE